MDVVLQKQRKTFLHNLLLCTTTNNNKKHLDKLLMREVINDLIHLIHSIIVMVELKKISIEQESLINHPTVKIKFRQLNQQGIHDKQIQIRTINLYKQQQQQKIIVVVQFFRNKLFLF
jgi:hypothetical protein